MIAAVLSSAMLYGMWPKVQKSFAVTSAFRQRCRFLILHTALLLVAMATFSTHTLDFSGNRVTHELAADGLSSLFQAFNTNHLDYLQYYRTSDQNMLDGRLRQQLAVSQMDIASTVLGLLGLPYRAPFFGRNVLVGDNSNGVLLFNHNHDVAMYRDGKMVVLGLQKAVTTYAYELGTGNFRKVAEDEQLTDLATAYFQTAFNLFEDHRYR
jgi:hypothetical protein